MGNVWTSNNRRDTSKNWTPYGEEFSRKKSKRWSLRKQRGYYKTVSDLDVERGIPLYLHYQAPNSIEEDLFTRDSRIPCVIHLHQRTRQDLNHLLRGSEAYSKGPRPKSLDPRLLMDDSIVYDELDPYSPQSPRNSSFMSSSAHISPRVKQEREQQQRQGVSNSTPDQNMKIDSSSANIDIIKVDTSGEKFQRQANLRRSQRLSSCSAVRQRANASQRRQLRHKHKTLTGLPGNVTSELNGCTVRPYSLHSDANNSSFAEAGLSDESRSYINGHAVSPNQRNAEIQTDDVRVIPITPAQRRMKEKGIKSNHASPASSHGSTEFLDSPTKVPCPTVPKMKQNSTPINGHADREIIRPTSLDVKNNDTSTDEGRHTGESNPPTPVRNGTPNELSASPNLKKSPSSPIATIQPSSNGNLNNNEKPNNIALRNGARLQQQGEDRASSGCWSGTESVQHSSSSDITVQHAPVINALQHMLKHEKPHSPVYSNSVGQISPIVDSRSLVCTSAVDSSSSISINSKLSTMDLGTSTSSLYDDDRFDSATSSVISVTLNRSNNNSTLSLNSSDGGKAISAKAILKKSRKSRLNATAGSYNFMNYEVDTLEPAADEISRTVKNRRSARSTKHRGLSKKRHTAEDTISVSSLADSSPQNTDPDAHSTHSGGMTNDTASLCDSMFSVDQEGYYTSMHDDCGLSKIAPQYAASVTSMPETGSPGVRSLTPNPVDVHPAVFEEGTRNTSGDENRSNTYNSYNRAVKSNHSTPKSLLTPRGKSASVKSPKPVEPPALDFQSELNKRLSVRRSPVGSKSPITKKTKRGPPPPPPKRASSLSGSSSPSPSSSVKSLSEQDTLPFVSSPRVPAVSPGATTSRTPQKVVKSPEEFYKTTPPPPPPIDQLPPPPPELLHTVVTTSTHAPADPSSFPPPPPVPVALSPSPVKSPVTPKSPGTSKSPRSPIAEDSPYQSIAMQAALLGSRMSQKKKNSVKSTTAIGKAEVSPKPGKASSQDVTDAVTVQSTSPLHVDTKKVPPPTAPKTTHVIPVDETSPFVSKKGVESKMDKIPPPTSPKTIHVISSGNVQPSKTEEVVKSPPPTAPKTTTVATVVTDAPNTSPVTKVPPPVASKPVNPPVEFSAKRTREQSPSYRASMARAAFFSTVSSPGPEVAPKPVKVPLITSTPKQEKDQKSPIESESAPQNLESTADKKNNLEPPKPEKAEISPEVKSDATTSEAPQKAVEDTESESIGNTDSPSTKEDNQSITDLEVTAPDSNDWLEKIEEFAPPSRRDSSPNTSSDSAASRLGLTPGKQTKYSNHDNLMTAIHKSKREALSGKPSNSSPPSSPGTNGESFTFRANGNKSPASTLERKKNGRLSSNGHRNALSRRSTGGTSRDDFKALLLQNACRGTLGSQMSAAEKLQLNKPQGSAAAALSKQRPMSMNDAERKVAEESLPLDGSESTENSRSMLSLNDIRSAITSGSATTSRIGRSNRRGQAMEPKYATMSVHGKKHPPPSMSSKYNTRSRTPTRPMMSIDEDSETEKSPEQLRTQTKLNER